MVKYKLNINKKRMINDVSHASDKGINHTYQNSICIYCTIILECE